LRNFATQLFVHFWYLLNKPFCMQNGALRTQKRPCFALHTTLFAFFNFGISFLPPFIASAFCMQCRVFDAGILCTQRGPFCFLFLPLSFCTPKKFAVQVSVRASSNYLPCRSHFYLSNCACVVGMQYGGHGSRPKQLALKMMTLKRPTHTRPSGQSIKFVSLLPVFCVVCAAVWLLGLSFSIKFGSLVCACAFVCSCTSNLFYLCNVLWAVLFYGSLVSLSLSNLVASLCVRVQMCAVVRALCLPGYLCCAGVRMTWPFLLSFTFV